MVSVAIDGPAGAGKSTLARRLAAELGYIYVAAAGDDCVGKVAPGINGHLPVLDQLHQFPLLLPGDLVCLGGGVDAPARHHHRLHTGGQQLDQRALRRVVCQQGKVPGDAVVQLLLAEGRLEVDFRMIPVFFHVPQMAGCAQGGDLAHAVITSGGVSVREVDTKTMQSKKALGLYFAGEVLDVDAYTGGYNLQIAFCTAQSFANNL